VEDGKYGGKVGEEKDMNYVFSMGRTPLSHRENFQTWPSVPTESVCSSQPSTEGYIGCFSYRKGQRLRETFFLQQRHGYQTTLITLNFESSLGFFSNLELCSVFSEGFQIHVPQEVATVKEVFCNNGVNRI
jgi:hypothetical protein